MTFVKALKKLNIEDYKKRIINSNSHGELHHLLDYIRMADTSDDLSWFRNWFIEVIKYAEVNWKAPEVVFQHIPKILIDSVMENK